MFNFQSTRVFTVAAIVFAAATIFNAHQAPDDETAGKGRLVAPIVEPAPVDVRLGPTTLPGVSAEIGKRS